MGSDDVAEAEPLALQGSSRLSIASRRPRRKRTGSPGKATWLCFLALVLALGYVAWVTRPAAHSRNKVFETQRAARECQILMSLYPEKTFWDFPMCLPPQLPVIRDYGPPTASIPDFWFLATAAGTALVVVFACSFLNSLRPVLEWLRHRRDPRCRARGLGKKWLRGIVEAAWRRNVWCSAVSTAGFAGEVLWWNGAGVFIDPRNTVLRYC